MKRILDLQMMQATGMDTFGVVIDDGPSTISNQGCVASTVSVGGCSDAELTVVTT